MNDLLKKLKSMGLSFEKPSDIQEKNQSSKYFDDIFEGRWIRANDRKIFLIEKEVLYGECISLVELKEPKISQYLFQLFHMDGDPWNEKSEFVFLDTETSSLSIGAGSFIFMVGICYFTNKGLKIKQFVLPDLNHEILLLNVLDEELKKFSTIVTYNGKAFDAPIIRSRFMLNKIKTDIDTMIHIDLLHLARRLWKLRLSSRRLSDIEQKILGIQRSGEEIPGWLVPQMYFDFLESRDAGLLKGVAYHNEMDIISLAFLFNKVNDFSHGGFTNLKNESLLDIFSVGDILRRERQFSLAEKIFEFGEGENIEKLVPPDYIHRYGLTLKKNGNFEKAAIYFAMAARKGYINACIELAKYYEHSQKNFKKAKEMTQRAIELSRVQNKSEKLFDQLMHRLSRVDRKLESENDK